MGFFVGCRKGRVGSAAFFAAGHDGGVEAFAEIGGKVVNLVGKIDLDGFAGGVEDNFAVSALVKMLFDLGARFGGNGIVNQVVKQCDKFGAGHASTPKNGKAIALALPLLRTASGAKALLPCVEMMHGLRPVPFWLEPVPFRLKPVPSKKE